MPSTPRFKIPLRSVKISPSVAKRTAVLDRMVMERMKIIVAASISVPDAR
jgi:hypothetical protein